MNGKGGPFHVPRGSVDSAADGHVYFQQFVQIKPATAVVSAFLVDFFVVAFAERRE